MDSSPFEHLPECTMRCENAELARLHVLQEVQQYCLAWAAKARKVEREGKSMAVTVTLETIASYCADLADGAKNSA